jgi:hypothetical protein
MACRLFLAITARSMDGIVFGRGRTACFWLKAEWSRIT